ncbi:exonuclease domain-containing protein [Ferrimonas senticii]|uniref:exonuclease domain-containing protein n=1 Tax=Ferrimonas senticii TaxID=394566 RepID=UPI0003F6257B|nr:exonuclease domain-containing protein [Ferrimonas senticii]
MLRSSIAKRYWQHRFGLWRAPKALQPYFEQFPIRLNQSLAQTPLLALDLELTGLNPAADQIVSVAAVPMDQGQLRLGQCLHQAVTIAQSVGHSATIHGLRDLDLAQGQPLPQVLEALLPMLCGRVLVCHHAPLDVAFLRRAFAKVYGWPLPLLVLDTLAIERQRLARQSQPLKKPLLQLAACRQRYHLPAYADHCALTDAIACGELLLAQQADADPNSQLTVAQLLY